MDAENEQSWLSRAEEYSGKKNMNAEYFQGLGLLAIAEALHRVAQAIEVSRPQN
jgi:hypothetical protein